MLQGIWRINGYKWLSPHTSFRCPLEVMECVLHRSAGLLADIPPETPMEEPSVIVQPQALTAGSVFVDCFSVSLGRRDNFPKYLVLPAKWSHQRVKMRWIFDIPAYLGLCLAWGWGSKCQPLKNYCNYWAELETLWAAAPAVDQATHLARCLPWASQRGTWCLWVSPCSTRVCGIRV